MKIIKVSLLLFISLVCNAQSIKDSSLRIVAIGTHLSYQFPDYDLAKRFGNSFSLGGEVMLKTKRYFLFGIEGSYFFGNTVYEDVLKPLKNSDGFITNNVGNPANLEITHGGWYVLGYIGKLLNVVNYNKNSGILVKCGIGYMQHFVKFNEPPNMEGNIPALQSAEMIKGFDRYTGGIATMQYIGFVNFGTNKLTNFALGFELFQGYTSSYRKFNFNTGQADTQQRFDMLYGFRFTWYLPLYKQVKEFYY